MHRLLPPKLVALLIALMVIASVLLPWPRTAWPIRGCGIVLMALGLVLNVGHANLFNRIGTNIKTFNDPGQLVRSGAFRRTRNPMYLGFVLILSGLAALLGSAVAWVGPAAFFIAADRWYIPFEERRMAATFGADYERYRADVRRWAGPRSRT